MLQMVHRIVVEVIFLLGYINRRQLRSNEKITNCSSKNINCNLMLYHYTMLPHLHNNLLWPRVYRKFWLYLMSWTQSSNLLHIITIIDNIEAFGVNFTGIWTGYWGLFVRTTLRRRLYPWWGPPGAHHWTARKYPQACDVLWKVFAWVLQ